MAKIIISGKNHSVAQFPSDLLFGSRKIDRTPRYHRLFHSHAVCWQATQIAILFDSDSELERDTQPHATLRSFRATPIRLLLLLFLLLLPVVLLPFDEAVNSKPNKGIYSNEPIRCVAYIVALFSSLPVLSATLNLWTIVADIDSSVSLMPTFESPHTVALVHTHTHSGCIEMYPCTVLLVTVFLFYFSVHIGCYLTCCARSYTFFIWRLVSVWLRWRKRLH